MNQRDRNQKKKKARQERLRKEKHLRRFQPQAREEVGPGLRRAGAEAEASRPASVGPQRLGSGPALAAGHGETQSPGLLDNPDAQNWLDGLCSGTDADLI